MQFLFYYFAVELNIYYRIIFNITENILILSEVIAYSISNYCLLFFNVPFILSYLTESLRFLLTVFMDQN